MCLPLTFGTFVHNLVGLFSVNRSMDENNCMESPTHMPQDTPEMETLVTTTLEDLRITDKHAAIPRWLIEPAPPRVTALARLKFRPEPLSLIAWLKPQDSPRGD